VEIGAVYNSINTSLGREGGRVGGVKFKWKAGK